MIGDATTASRRPNLTDRGPLDEIRHLLSAREPAYRAAAHLAVDTEGKPPEALVEEILVQLAMSPSGGAGA